MLPWQALLQCPPALAALCLSRGHQGGGEPRTCSHRQWHLGMVVWRHMQRGNGKDWVGPDASCKKGMHAALSALSGDNDAAVHELQPDACLGSAANPSYVCSRSSLPL